MDNTEPDDDVVSLFQDFEERVDCRDGTDKEQSW